MKGRILIDSQVTVKAGTIVDIDEKQYNILKALNRIEEAEMPKQRETATSEVKKETRKAKK